MQFDYIVTGSAGLLGSSVTAFLRNLGHEVLEIDMRYGHDLRDEECVKKLFQANKSTRLINLFGLDAKVSGLGFGSSFLSIDLNEFRESLEVNVTALFSVCREFVRNNDSGSIVNFSSIYGIRSPDPRNYSAGEKPIAYGVSKAAVLQMTRQLAVSAAPNFRVNSVILGGVYDSQPESFLSAYTSGVPLGRMALPSDICGVLLLLTSTEGSYITGASIIVDGGKTLI